ncbi:pro-resilin-like [Coccinella septempunctata]|uniref:pro-resilin-like n=1 Tax=Coccinella septempunctata TaxID=41139 RepID=UPI001D08CC88|nr:pro-resilin-like [Coccinella septempunctata]
MLYRQSLFLFIGCFSLLTVQSAPQGFPVRGITNIDGAPEPYNYNYRVENPPTGTFFGQNENGDAAGRVTGSYFVQLPDGRLMNVEYFVDGDSGFVPKISYQTGSQLVGGPLRV